MDNVLDPKVVQLLDFMEEMTQPQFAFIAGFCAQRDPELVSEALVALHQAEAIEL